VDILDALSVDTARTSHVEEVFDRVAADPTASDQWLVAQFIAADLLAAAISLPIALLLLSWTSTVRDNSLDRFWSNLGYDSSFPAAIVIALAVAGFYRANRRTSHASVFAELKELAIALCAGCVLSIGVSVIVHLSFDVRESSTTQLLLAAIVAIALIAIAHALLNGFRRGVHSRVLILGSGSLVDRIAGYFSLTKGVRVVGRIVDAMVPEEGSLGTVSDIPRLCDQFHVNRIIVAFPTVLSQDAVTVFRSLPSTVHIAVVPRYFELVSWRSRITDLYGLPLVEIAPAHFSLWDRFLKRAFDIIAGSLFLLVLSPVALTLAVLVKLSSPGPILFRQRRTGKGRQPFTIYKFRSMVVGDPVPSTEAVDDELSALIPLHKLRNKAVEIERTTSIGRFMRRTGLDELPQFLNVIRGDMSLVGPRPFTEDESETFQGWQARRFETRPGITGLWQVSGRNDLSTEELRRLDYLYVASWSIWWDFKIAWETPKAMVRGFGAY
jgi:exopolysaccharide biosynthesis polyprenyl glycosylphosphotransferase